MNDYRRQTDEMGRRFKEKLSEAQHFPEVVLIDTVSFCDLQCSMCVHKNMNRKRGIIEWGLFTSIIDEIASNNKNTRVWMVFFGEALIIKNRKPSIFDMIRYAKSKGLTDVVLNSNGNLMDEKAAIGLIESGLDSIYIGLDAFSSETYSKLRVGGVYEQAKDNTLRLIRLRNQLKASTPSIFVQFVEMDENRFEKDDFINYWNESGATVKIRPKVSWAGNIEADNLVLDNKDRWPCYWAMKTMSITNTGDVVTCASDLDARYIAGNVNKNSLFEIWNGVLQELRKCHINRDYLKLPENCANCRDWQSARADFYRVNT